MLHLHPREIDDRAAETTPSVYWPPVVIALIAAMLLLLGTLGPLGLDRLLPEGQPFLPYFTT